MDKCDVELVKKLQGKIEYLEREIAALGGKLICSCGHMIQSHTGLQDGVFSDGGVGVGVCRARVQDIEPVYCHCHVFTLRKGLEDEAP